MALRRCSSQALWGVRSRSRCLTWLLSGLVVLVDEAAENWPAGDPFAGKVDGWVIGPGWPKLATALRPLPVVVGLVLGQDRLQMALTED
jgi:hypothetical protein